MARRYRGFRLTLKELTTLPASCRATPRPDPTNSGEDNSLRVAVITRQGHVITTIHHVPGEMESMLSILCRRLGTGGTVRAGAIELRGDHAQVVCRILVAQGFKVRRCGPSSQA